jgi:hypothetical protein
MADMRELPVVPNLQQCAHGAAVISVITEKRYRDVMPGWFVAALIQ